jgi:hypothetical protein
MKTKIILFLLLLSTQLYSQKFNRVEVQVTNQDTTVFEEQKVNITFRLDEVNQLLYIKEDGIESVITYDVAEHRRNGIYLLTKKSPDYFIINSTWVLHHRCVGAFEEALIIRCKYVKAKQV